MKSKETLEEAANKIYPNNGFEDELYWDLGEIYREKFIEGAKWQQERMYSYMKKYADYCLRCSAGKTLKIPLQPSQWFEQFKKK